jgi:hypothetical protein
MSPLYIQWTAILVAVAGVVAELSPKVHTDQVWKKALILVIIVIALAVASKAGA